MAATAATIQIALEAQTAQLKRGFGQARQSVDKLGASLSGKIAAGMAKFHLALGAVKAALAAVRGAINSVADAMGRLDTEAKVAARLNVAADQLKILNFAAEQTGSSANTLQMALQRMVRRINEASHGSGEAVKALKELGLSAEALTTMTADQQFAAVADAMEKVGGQSDKVRLAMKLFDSEGVQLVNTMKGGSAALNAFGKQLEGSGALLGDAREGIEAASDAINRMKKAWSSVVERIAVVVAPALEWVADALGKITGAFSRLFGSATGTLGTMQEFGTATKAAVAAVPSLGEAAAKTGEKMVTAAERAREIVAKIKDEFADAINPTTAIGAVTRGSTAGFSAVREMERAQKDAARRDKKRNELLEAIERGLKREGLSITGVDLGI
jgi:hypothetical protein